MACFFQFILPHFLMAKPAEQNKFEGANEAYARAIDMKEKSLGSNDPAVAIIVAKRALALLSLVGHECKSAPPNRAGTLVGRS